MRQYSRVYASVSGSGRQELEVHFTAEFSNYSGSAGARPLLQSIDVGDEGPRSLRIFNSHLTREEL